MGALCLRLVFEMVGKRCALLVPYGGLLVLCLACSLWWFISVVPSLTPCGGLLRWFLEIFRSIFHLQIDSSLSPISYFVSVLFAMIVSLMLGLVMIWLYANTGSCLTTALDSSANSFSSNFLVLVSFPLFLFMSLTL